MHLLSHVKLFDYQIDAFEWMKKREASSEAPGGVLSLDMGLGKTLLTIATICANPVRTLIIVPTNLVSQWCSEFEKFTGETPFVVDVTLSNKGRVTVDSLSHQDVVLAPMSVFSSMRDESVLQCPFDRIVVDEAHLIRNKRTKSYKRITSMDAKIKWCLTGTPIVKNEKNFMTLLEFMGIHTINLRYAAREYIYRRVKEDVIEMPKLIIEELRDEFRCPEERKAYEELLSDGKSALAAYRAYSDGEGRMELLKILLRLRQCTSNVNMVPNYDDPNTYYCGESSKLKMLENDILSSPMQKTIIFAHFIKEMNFIVAMLRSHGFDSVRLDGRIKHAERHHAIKRFKEDSSCNFFVVQIDAGGIGLNLQTATRIYMNGVHWNGSNEIQAIARAYRIGQTKPVVVKRLIINDTIDDAIIGVQQSKFETAADILEDPRIKTSLTKKKTGEFMKLVDAIFSK